MILPSREDRGIVVFWVLPALTYGVRLAASGVLILAGLVMQGVLGSALPGVLLLAAGNLLLLVKGYDNRVDFEGFEADAHWERVDAGKLEELKDLHARMRRWDRSLVDVTNPWGLLAFVLVAGLLGLWGVATEGIWRILAIDAAVLLMPHWVTGIRSILVRPKLLVRIDAIHEVLDRAAPKLRDHQVTLLMLLGGTETPIPDDVKFKVDIKGRAEGFLGLYGQVVINEVQGSSYPYFYVVLVAKHGFGLHQAFRAYRPSGEITKEFKREKNVEVFVVRQHTTKTSGYHTKPDAAIRIFDEGFRIAKRVAAGVAA
ncbi:MAG: hypothetical protein OEO20_06900 [Gemmatimonadota bacterium]|nr:hypothetical protein [Gemmatimonadota bacterium]MDH3478015.1 hypothetical protein [Gemmatimonadota bacterium]MDH3568801.1 hypothetical protein [Gemmatimonadota bacterium]MDH5549439.1 hypothetical protein [Gemmatimonadota bacterium]